MSLLLTGTLKVSLVLIVALSIAAALRRQPPALRHWVLAAALACAAAMPLVELMAPRWHLPAGTLASALPALAPPAGTPAERLPQGSATGAVVPAAPVRPAHTVHPLVAIWLAGVAFGLSVLLAGSCRLARLARAAAPATAGSWRSAAADVARRYGLRRPVLLLQSDHPTLLATWGLRQPKVLLPAGAAGWSEARIRMVLAHEVAHVRRRDWLAQTAADCLRAVYWFNPLVWIVCRRLREEAEQACDEEVLALGADRSAYASELLELARMFGARQRTFWSAPAAARASGLERRIAAMLDLHHPLCPVVRSTRWAAAAALLAVAIPVAGFTASAQGAGISGTLFDASGRAVSDAVLQLTRVDTEAGHETRTDADGRFAFAGLAAGDYALEVRAPGFAPLRSAWTLAAGQQIRRAITLQLGTVQETMTVSEWGAAPVATATDPARLQAFRDSFRGAIQPPLKVRHVQPEYPAGLDEAGSEGSVTVEGRIAADGSLTGLRGSGPAHPALVSAAVNAVSRWQFEPTRLHGVPVETAINVTVVFEPR